MWGLRWSPTVSSSATSLQDLAACYLSALRAVQPEGPYRLLGYSIGGSIAFEMARQLESRGEQVALLALADTPNYTEDRALLESFLVTATRNALSWLRGMSWVYKVAALSSSLGRIPSARRLGALLQAQRRMRSFAMAWRPGPVTCDMVLFRSKGRRRGLDDTLGWSGLSPRVIVHEVEGDHITMLHERNAPRLACLLAECGHPHEDP